MSEVAVAFGLARSLVGVLTLPDEVRAARPAFVFLNAGVTHRVGPNRLYVRMARQLAAAGFTSLRFDFSGIGDSSVRADDLQPEQSIFAETQEALQMLAREHGVQRFVLIGICSGATISFLTAKRDERVVGAVLINAQGHLHGMDAELGEHLRSRTLARHFWRIATVSSFRSKNLVKALRGQLDPRRILRMMIGLPMRLLFKKRETGATPVKLPDAAADLRAVAARGVYLLHVYSEGDDGLDYFHVLLSEDQRAVFSNDHARFEILRGANHVFTLRWSQEALIEIVRDWAEIFEEPAAGTSPTAQA